MAKTHRAWQRMLSGRRLDLLDPTPVDIEIEDIAHGLSRVSRWNGQTTGDHPFSVAAHSVFVEQIVGALEPGAGASVRLLARLHDAPEYVIGDLISPFKAVIGADYKALETRLLGAILIRFGLPAAPSAEAAALVKRADGVAAYLEAVELAGFDADEADKIFGRPKLAERTLTALRPFTAAEPAMAAKTRFMLRFEALMAERGAFARP